MVNPLSLDSFWFNKRKFEEAERIFYEAKYGGVKTLEYNERYNKLKKEKEGLVKTIEDLTKSISKLELRINTLEKSSSNSSVPAKPSAPVKENKPAAEEDDDIDLFGSDEDDEAAEKARAERAAAVPKKAGKPGVVAKSSVVLEIKPWDDETDLEAMEKSVRSVQMDGLLWGTSKFVPVAYGVKKMQIVCVVEDEKVSIEELSEKIESFEDYVQSVDVVAFNKI